MSVPRTLPNGNVLIRSAPSGEEVIVKGPYDFYPLEQYEWAIDPVNGSDTAAGTLAAPLLTGAEWTRRTYGRGASQMATLDLLGAWPSVTSDYLAINLAATNPASGLTVRMENPPVSLEGSFTVVNNAVADTSLTTVQTDIDLSAFRDYRLRITSSATAPVGTTMWVENVAAGVATLSAPTFVDASDPTAFWTASFPSLSVGDTFVVEVPNNAPPLWGEVTGIDSFVQSAWSYALRFTNFTMLGHATVGSRFTNGYAIACKFQGFWNHFEGQTGFETSASRFSPCNIEGVTTLRGCSFGLLPGGTGNAFTTQNAGSTIQFFTRNSSRGLRYSLVCGSAILNHGGGNLNGGLSVHEWTASGGLGGIRVGERGRADFNGVAWGSSAVANTVGLQVDALGGIAYDPLTKPTISGAAANTRIGTTNTAYGLIPTFNTTFGAGIVEHQD